MKATAPILALVCALAELELFDTGAAAPLSTSPSTKDLLLCGPAFTSSSNSPKLSLPHRCRPRPLGDPRHPIMVMLTHPPYALFDLEGLSPQTLNLLLQKAYDGSTVYRWEWYLATSDYAAASQRKPDGTGQQGTIAPISPAFSSLFVGQSLLEVTQWLRDKPKSVDVDPRFFGVLDKQSKNAEKVVLCRLEDPKREKDGATCVLSDAGPSSLWLSGLDSDLDWNEWVKDRRYRPSI
ncbi:MAG: hypothetical protein Q9225_006926 [Loekoesia sp. 1 TL-2023]